MTSYMLLPTSISRDVVGVAPAEMVDTGWIGRWEAVQNAADLSM